MNRLAIYCGSATPADPRYIELAREVRTDEPSYELMTSVIAGWLEDVVL